MGKNLKYSGVGLDRVNALRRDEAWVKDRLGAPGTRVVPVWRGRNLVVTGSQPEPVFLEGEAAGKVLGISAETAGPVVLLGQDDNTDDKTVYAAADLSALDEDALDPFTETGQFKELRRFGALMAGPDAALLAYARGMVHWHQRHLFCGVCGQPTESRDGGHMRICNGGGDSHMHFPRTDPAVIMLVTHDDPEGNGPACLLGRQSQWIEGMYSTLAGFVEPGESLEEAVAREVEEESSIRVTDVQYMASQPWPFPSSLMLGFRAKALTTEIKIDNRELEDARWFTAVDMREFGEWPTGGAKGTPLITEKGAGGATGERRLPRKDSIARFLVDSWLEDTDDG